MSTELPVATRHRRVMTEKLLKATLNSHKQQQHYKLNVTGDICSTTNLVDDWFDFYGKNWLDCHKIDFETDGRVKTEMSSKVRGSQDQMWRCSKFNQPSQLINNSHFRLQLNVRVTIILYLRSGVKWHFVGNTRLSTFLTSNQKDKLCVLFVTP